MCINLWYKDVVNSVYNTLTQGQHEKADLLQPRNFPFSPAEEFGESKDVKNAPDFRESVR